MNRLITSIAVSALLIQTSLSAIPLYVGVEYERGANSLEGELTGYPTQTKDYTTDALKLKGGVFILDDLRIQGSLNFIKYDDSIFDADNKSMIEISAEMLKSFDVSSHIDPFILAGVGSGFMSVDKDIYDNGNINAFSLRIGGGALFELSKSFEATAGIYYQYRKWQEIQFINGPKFSVKESNILFNIGLNFIAK